MYDDDYKYRIKVGDIIKKQREYLEFSQEILAEKADISTQHLSDIENGKKGFTVGILYRLCRALHMSPNRVVFGEENQTDVQKITELLESIDEKYIYLAEEHIKIFLKTIQYINW